MPSDARMLIDTPHIQVMVAGRISRVLAQSVLPVFYIYPQLNSSGGIFFPSCS